MASKASRSAQLKRTVGSAKWVERIAMLNAIRALRRALERNEPVEHQAARMIVKGILAWEAEAGALTLDRALGLTARGWRHALEEYGIMTRNSAYLLELAHLLGLGFTPKEADFAIAQHFSDSMPWSRAFPRLRPLAEASVTALRKEHLRTGHFVIDRNGLPSTVEECIAASRAWDAAERQAYLAPFPPRAIPARFRA